ncbi:MAG: transcriptional repressor LexA [Nitrospira sp.]|nr:transcriptional repressor LexA [Nitrospira sp.]MCP9460792.1 transcriptional repressor LexA [Nitrospira sp.]MCP9475007.1 transcriptional repressor LexA [Nitrospira sp.]
MKPHDFKRLREQLGLTQRQLAEALKTTRVTIARYEAGMRNIPGSVQVAIEQMRQSITPPTPPLTISLAGTVAAGLPIEPIEQSESVEIPPGMVKGGTAFALRVKGDSMKDEGILPGDLVIIRKQETARNGQTVVAMVNREATIKIYVKTDTHIELRPANVTMAPIVVKPSDEFRIEGVLIGVIRHCAS